jgi:predicted N-acetyltransferase YhbS
MIRKATSDDISAIRSLMKSVQGVWQKSWREDVLEQGIDSANGLAFIWEEEKEILGFICAHDLCFRGYISELVVAEKARKKGIGKKLVESVHDKLIERGCSVVIADVWRDAENFYRKLGWDSPDVILLAKRLRL